MSQDVSKIVNNILRESQVCRDSDSELILAVLECLGLDLDFKQRRIMLSTNFESIRRERQALQAEGKYPSSPAVAKKRRQKADHVQQVIPTLDAEQVQKVIYKPMEWGL